MARKGGCFLRKERGKNRAIVPAMSEASTDQLKQAIESQHGGTATFVQSTPIREMHGDEVAWEGVVSIFDLTGHPKTTRAYAWSYDKGDGQCRFFAVLGIPPITGPREAVRAAIVAEQRAERGQS